MTTKNPKDATELNEEDLDAVTGGNGFFNMEAQLQARDERNKVQQRTRSGPTEVKPISGDSSGGNPSDVASLIDLSQFGG